MVVERWSLPSLVPRPHPLSMLHAERGRPVKRSHVGFEVLTVP